MKISVIYDSLFLNYNKIIVKKTFYEFLTRNNLQIFVIMMNFGKILTSDDHIFYCEFKEIFFLIFTNYNL